MAALSTDAFQEKRHGTLLRSVRGRWRTEANAEFDAEKVWRAHVWPRRTDRTRIEIFDLSGAGSLERNYGRAISGRAAHACEFLEGRSREMINALDEQMRKAADKMEFEK